jgi:hypothetical protein
MLIPIQYLETPAKSFVVSTSRYINSKVLLYSDKKFTTFETYKRKPVAESPDDRYSVITAGEEFRPDKTSLRAYNTPDFWWRIMEANNISDIFNYKSGLNIRIPAPFT